jgi:hypothetical protein
MSTDRDEIRYFKRLLHVEETESGECRIIVTDGKRLHIAELTLTLPEGNYEVNFDRHVASVMLKGPIPGNTEYPNYHKIMFTDEEEIAVVELYDTSMGRNVLKALKMSRQYAYIIRNIEKIINIRYLNDLMKCSWTVYVDKEKKNEALLFKTIDTDDKELMALIMPAEC